LAETAGYSERLVRKAEAGGSLHADTIEVLASALSTDEQIVHPEDLTAQPRQLAAAILRGYTQSERQLVANTHTILSEDMTCWCAGDPEHVPFAGQFSSIDGFDRFWGVIFSLLVRPDKQYYRPRLLVDGNEVIAIGEEQMQLDGAPAPNRLWLMYRMIFERGKLIRFEDYYDTRNGTDYFVNHRDLVKRLMNRQ
jgi:hypothetical protein